MHIFVDLGQVLRREGNWSFFSEVIECFGVTNFPAVEK